MPPPRKRHNPREADDRGGGLLDFFASLNPFAPQNPFRNTGATLFDLFNQFVGGGGGGPAPGTRIGPAGQGEGGFRPLPGQTPAAPTARHGAQLPAQYRKEPKGMQQWREQGQFTEEDLQRMGYGGR